MGINEIVYRSSFVVSIPENFLINTFVEISDYTTFYNDFKEKTPLYSMFLVVDRSFQIVSQSTYCDVHVAERKRPQHEDGQKGNGTRERFGLKDPARQRLRPLTTNGLGQKDTAPVFQRPHRVV